MQESSLTDLAGVAKDGYDALMVGDNKVISGFAWLCKSQKFPEVSTNTTAEIMIRAFSLLLFISFTLGSCSVLDHDLSVSSLQAVYQSDTIWNGVAIANGRVFVCYPHNDGSAGTRIGEVMAAGKVVPYPSADWNNWTPGAPASQKFVRTNSLRFGPDGLLWIVDTGTPKADGSVVTNGPKLIAIDITTNQVVKSIGLDAVAREKSFVDDLRFNDPFIYITDAGVPALIVLNTATREARRVLENDTSTTDRRLMLGEGKVLIKPNGEPVKLHADQMEVSPDGSLFYFQPASGPMYRILTKALNDASISPTDLAKQVSFFFDSPTTGGTAMDADGTIYLNDVNQKRLLKIMPNGQATTVLQDDRLIWGDAIWIDTDGYLWIPAPQMNRTPEFQHGVSTVEYPVKMYKLKTGAKPLRR